MDQDELRRTQRVKVCCRVDVRDRFGVWNAVTEDVCARGCRLVTAKSPRLGTVLELTLSSDLFPEVLEVTAYASWVSDRRVGVTFIATGARRGAHTSVEWVQRLVEHGTVQRPEPRGSASQTLVPAVRRPAPGRAGVRPTLVTMREGPEGDEVRVLPLQHG
jgi:hypothetical protein